MSLPLRIERIPSGVTYTRAEVLGVLASQEPGGKTDAFEFTVRITPELLAELFGGTWIARDGKRARFAGVHVDKDGLATPWMEEIR